LPKTTIGDLRIHWESYGKKEPLLLISGVSGGTWSWEESIEAWFPHFRVIVFDNIGAGRSSKPNRPYTIEEMADHAAAVLDAAGVRHAGVVGLSMGGMIAQELALRHPDRVHHGLVLGCTHCGGRKRIPPHPNVIQRFADNKGLSPEEIIDKNLMLLVTPQFLRGGSDALKRYKERQLKAPLQPDYALKRQLDAIGGFNACERIGNIQIPTLILTAERDLLVPPENSRLLSTQIPDAAEKFFANAGHLIYLECAQDFHETVINFFRNTA
jgi:pimeloyl-ACP methyl ester carboxylesterase